MLSLIYISSHQITEQTYTQLNTGYGSLNAEVREAKKALQAKVGNFQLRVCTTFIPPIVAAMYDRALAETPSVDLMSMTLGEVLPRIREIWPTTPNAQVDFVKRMWGEAVNIVDLFTVFDTPTDAPAQIQETCRVLRHRFRVAAQTIMWECLQTRTRYDKGRWPDRNAGERDIARIYLNKWKAMPLRDGFPPCPNIRLFPVRLFSGRPVKIAKVDKKDHGVVAD